MFVAQFCDWDKFQSEKSVSDFKIKLNATYRPKKLRRETHHRRYSWTLTIKWERDSWDYCRACGDGKKLKTIEDLLCHCPSLNHKIYRDKKLLYLYTNSNSI